MEEELSSPPSVYANEDDTPLSPREMSRLSRKISVSDSYKLAAIMGISNEERDHIRCDPNYNERSRVEKILSIFNRKEDFSRQALGSCLEEIQKLDLVVQIITGEWRSL